MNRSFNSLHLNAPVGTQEGVVAAQAIANRFPVETILAVHDLLTTMERHGGEATISSYRFPFIEVEDPETGERGLARVEPGTPGATYQTAGMLFHYDHVAKRTREATRTPVEGEADQRLSTHLPLIEEVNDDSEGNSVDAESNGGTAQPDIPGALEDSARASGGAPAQVGRE